MIKNHQVSSTYIYRIYPVYVATFLWTSAELIGRNSPTTSVTKCNLTASPLTEVIWQQLWYQFSLGLVKTCSASVLCVCRLISMGSLSHCKNASVRNTGWFKPFAFTLAWSCFSSFKWKGDLASCWGLYNNHNNYLNCSVTAAKCSYFP